MNRKVCFWNGVLAGVILAIGLVCLVLDRIFEYPYSYSLWGLGWLLLGGVSLWAALRERRREAPRDLQWLFTGGAYLLLALAWLGRGALLWGLGWLALAAVSAVRGVRRLRGEPT